MLSHDLAAIYCGLSLALSRTHGGENSAKLTVLLLVLSSAAPCGCVAGVWGGGGGGGEVAGGGARWGDVPSRRRWIS